MRTNGVSHEMARPAVPGNLSRPWLRPPSAELRLARQALQMALAIDRHHGRDEVAACLFDLVESVATRDRLEREEGGR